jgi:hypothetical protein
MILSIVDLLLVTATPLLLGAATLSVIGVRPGDGRLAALAWAASIGALGISILGFVSLSVGSAPGPLWLAIAAVLGGLVWAADATRRRRQRSPSSDPQAPETPTPQTQAPDSPVRGATRGAWGADRIAMLATIALAIVLTLIRMLEAYRNPIVLNDESWIWSAKAKALYLAGGHNQELADLLSDQPEPLVYHPDYPPFNPLLQLWIFRLAGGVTHAANRIPLQLLMLAMLLALAAALRHRVRGVIVAVLVLPVLASPVLVNLTRAANSDHLVALGLLIVVDGWLRWNREQRSTWWRLMALGLGILVWSKPEGWMLAACVTLALLPSLRRGAAPGMEGTEIRPALLLSRRKALSRREAASRREAIWLALPAALAVSSWLFNRSFGLRNDLVTDHSGASIWVLIPEQLTTRLVPVVTRFLEELLHLPTGAAVLALVALLLLLVRRQLRASGMLASGAALLAALLGYQLVYIGSYLELEWHLATSADRVIFQLTPAATVWVAAAIATLWPNWAVGQGRQVAPD